jgi:hypothetical protein
MKKEELMWKIPVGFLIKLQINKVYNSSYFIKSLFIGKGWRGDLCQELILMKRDVKVAGIAFKFVLKK